jgi:transcriptional regulator with XRE-family HTH domain
MAGILRRNDYAFVDKHSIVDEIRTAIQDSGEPVEFIAHSAGVSRATIDAWMSGKTRKPYSSSLEAVARALGKHLSLSDGVLHLADPAPPVSPRNLASVRHVVQMSKYMRAR